MFVVTVDSLGVVTLDQQRAVVHADGSDPDDSRSLASAGLVVLTATAHDKDGDTASSALNVGTQLIFKDDGPSITGTIVGAPSPTDDESAAGTDSDSFFAQFTPVYGADGQGASPVTYALSTPGGVSGLTDTVTGNAVFLFLETGKIVGREGTSALDAAGGDIVFEVTVDSSGNVGFDQKRAVVHTPDTGTDQSTTLSSAGLVVLTATAHDKDGDTASAPLSIGTRFLFKDDSPTITSQILDGNVAFVFGATGVVSNSLNGSVGADVTNATQQSLSGVKQYIITSWTEPHTVFLDLDGVLSADGTKVTYYSTSVAANQNATTAVYELSLNQTANTGAGSYTFTVLKAPPIVQNNFDFTDLPSGQNFMGVIATDKADLAKGGLLVLASNPDLNADGSMTNVSGTVNTSKGGGPVTIGNANQAFDSTDEGAFFCYVDNPLATAVGGLGLTQTSADNANTIDFDGTNEATRASVEIVQASGAGRRSGPARRCKSRPMTSIHKLSVISATPESRPTPGPSRSIQRQRRTSPTSSASGSSTLTEMSSNSGRTWKLARRTAVRSPGEAPIPRSASNLSWMTPAPPEPPTTFTACSSATLRPITRSSSSPRKATTSPRFSTSPEATTSAGSTCSTASTSRPRISTSRYRSRTMTMTSSAGR